MNDRLNIFFSYDRLAETHENLLTRALLIVLRCSPLAHQAWLDLVAPERNLRNLPRASFGMQKRSPMLGVPLQSGEGPIPGVSVWLAPDAIPVEAPVEATNRLQVLDGIINYGSEFVVVFESKVRPGPPTAQPSSINLHGSPIEFAARSVPVSWQAVIDAFSDVVARELVTLAERDIIYDFLDLIEKNFSELGPYGKLSKYRKQHFRLEKRLDQIIEEATRTTKGKGLGWRDLSNTPKIFMAWLGLSADGASVNLQMYPADTLNQARAFYADADSVTATLNLRAHGWRLTPNFHWGFMAPGYAWMTSLMSLDTYCSYWVRNIEHAREVSVSEWDQYWASLVADGVVSASDRAAFDKEFTNTRRRTANPRPGIECEFQWPLMQAEQLDDSGKFVERVREKINAVLAALRAPSV